MGVSGVIENEKEMWHLMENGSSFSQGSKTLSILAITNPFKPYETQETRFS